MSEKELRELDAWIYENVPDMPSNGNPTRNPADAFQLEMACNKKAGIVTTQYLDPKNLALLGGLKAWGFMATGVEAQDNDRKIAICLFAKKLFKK